MMPPGRLTVRGDVVGSGTRTQEAYALGQPLRRRGGEADKRSRRSWCSHRRLPQMAFCSQCGSGIAEHAAFCSTCGKPTGFSKKAAGRSCLTNGVLAVVAVVGLLMLLAVLVTIGSSTDSPSSSPKPRLSPGYESRISTGDSSSAIAGVSKDDFEEIARSLRINDKIGAANVMLQGRGFFINPGTRVLVLETGIELVRVRVLEGPTIGRDGWVLRKWVE
jgi:hypothetical protein